MQKNVNVLQIQNEIYPSANCLQHLIPDWTQLLIWYDLPGGLESEVRKLFATFKHFRFCGKSQTDLHLLKSATNYYFVMFCTFTIVHLPRGNQSKVYKLYAVFDISQLEVNWFPPFEMCKRLIIHLISCLYLLKCSHLEASWTPVHKLDRSVCLDGGYCGVNILIWEFI